MSQDRLRPLLFGAMTALCNLLVYSATIVAIAQDTTSRERVASRLLEPGSTKDQSVLANVSESGGTRGYVAPGSLDLFYNYYAPTSGGGIPATLYLAPRPVPPTVGHVYYTYQALLPHEYLYPHYREYYTNYGNHHGYGASVGRRSLNRTVVRYQRGACVRPLYVHRLYRPQSPAVSAAQCAGGYGCQ